jgi:hypothetical protein
VTWAPYAGSICLANAAKPSRWFFIPAIATKPQPNGSIPAGNAPQTESALNAGRVEQKLGAVGPVGLPFFVRLDLGRIVGLRCRLLAGLLRLPLLADGLAALDLGADKLDPRDHFLADHLRASRVLSWSAV